MLTQTGLAIFIPATVPGCIWYHIDLNKIELQIVNEISISESLRGINTSQCISTKTIRNRLARTKKCTLYEWDPSVPFESFKCMDNGYDDGKWVDMCVYFTLIKIVDSCQLVDDSIFQQIWNDWVVVNFKETHTHFK